MASDRAPEGLLTHSARAIVPFGASVVLGQGLKPLRGGAVRKSGSDLTGSREARGVYVGSRICLGHTCSAAI